MEGFVGLSFLFTLASWFLTFPCQAAAYISCSQRIHELERNQNELRKEAGTDTNKRWTLCLSIFHWTCTKWTGMLSSVVLSGLLPSGPVVALRNVHIASCTRYHQIEFSLGPKDTFLFRVLF